MLLSCGLHLSMRGTLVVVATVAVAVVVEIMAPAATAM